MVSITHILLVEDSPDDAMLFLRLFKRHFPDIRIKWVDDSEEALQLLSNPDGSYWPDALIVDFKMPKINGLEVLKKVRSMPHTRALPYIIFSSSREERDIDQSYQLGVNSYVVKPIGAREFEETILRLGTYWSQVNQPPMAPKTNQI